MNIAEIKAAVDAAKTVHWCHTGYVVHKDDLGQYLITFPANGSSIGLTNAAGNQLNGQEKDFYIAGVNQPVGQHCWTCGGTNVKRDAWAVWDEENQMWELEAHFDHAICNDCDIETVIVERPILGAEQITPQTKADVAAQESLATAPAQLAEHRSYLAEGV